MEQALLAGQPVLMVNTPARHPDPTLQPLTEVAHTWDVGTGQQLRYTVVVWGRLPATYWIYYLYLEYKHRCTPLDGLPEGQPRVNNLVEYIS